MFRLGGVQWKGTKEGKVWTLTGSLPSGQSGSDRDGHIRGVVVGRSPLWERVVDGRDDRSGSGIGPRKSPWFISTPDWCP